MGKFLAVATIVLFALMVNAIIQSGDAWHANPSLHANPAFDRVFRCGDPCVIRYNAGGNVASFLGAAKAVQHGAREQVVIDGDCYSACVVFADIARKYVCVTPRAIFGFHKATLNLEYSNGAVTRMSMDTPHSSDITRWVYSRGGFPRQGYLYMNSHEATRFWRPC